MMLLKEQLKNIAAPCEATRTAVYSRWGSLKNTLEGWGLLEDAVAKIAALTGTLDVALVRRVLVVFCADNGVTGSFPFCGNITAEMAESLAEGRSMICHMARTAQCQVLPVDMGIVDTPEMEGILNRRITSGTSDITVGPAMVTHDCILALETGINLVRDLWNKDTSIILTGSMGIGNDITSCAVASVLLDEKPEHMLGKEPVLPCEKLKKKIATIKKAIAVNKPDRNDPLDVMTKVGGLDIAALCGLFLGCSLYQLPVVVDGFTSIVAALCASRICPQANSAMLASCAPTEPGGRFALEALGLRPFITESMQLGGGSDALMALPLLDMAFAIYSNL